MNISIKLDVTVNGAVVVPTPEQFAAITEAVNKIVFGESIQTPKPKGEYKKRVNRKTKGWTPWTSAEDDLLIRLAKEGQSYRTITFELYRKFGVKRTEPSVMSRIYNFKHLGKMGFISTTGDTDNSFPTTVPAEVIRS